MARNVIFNQFRSPDAFKNRYIRGPYFEIQDANLHHNDIRPFACPELMCDADPLVSKLFYLPTCQCFGFPDERDIVQGFCRNQYFHIDNGVLRQSTETELCDDDASCRAGVPVSTTAPNAAGGCGDCDGVAVSYVVTFVTRHSGIEVEGAPSPPSNIVVGSGSPPGTNVSWAAAPAGYCVVATRVYRTEASFEDGETQVPYMNSEWVLVAEFNNNGAAGAFADNVASSDTGGPLLTYDPMEFPAPTGLVALARTSDGLVVADQSRVYISVSGKPQFTWDGVIEVEDTILAIEAMNNIIFVLTDKYPVKISYQLNEGIMMVDRQIIKRHLPLKSKRSMSSYAGRLFFASEYSLYMWDTRGYGEDISSLLTPLLTPEQWKNINPDTIAGTAYEYGYIFSSGDIDYSLMIEIGGDGTDTVNQTSIMPISYINGTVFGLDDDGHIMYQEADGDVYRWDWRRVFCSEINIHDNVRPLACEQCGQCCPWHLKLYYDNERKNRFNHMRVEWDERSIGHIDLVFRAHEFGREYDITDTLEIISSRGFGIPLNVSYQASYAYLTSCEIMHEVRFGTSAQELTGASNRTLERANNG